MRKRNPAAIFPFSRLGKNAYLLENVTPGLAALLTLNNT
jgi:hypothetical protein